MNSNLINNKTILVTGGTGSFGNKFIQKLFDDFEPKKVIVFSRDEFKQHKMREKFPENKFPIRYFIGDVRDKDRLYRAFEGVDIVIHAAALKHVPVCEYNPFEAVKTNILGAQNIAEAAMDKGVKKVIALSTDKAVNPVNLYGSTKLSMEKIFVAANNYVGDKDTRFSLVRYGNVVGSRGSVVPLFLDFKRKGKKEYTVTDERMTRFWITLEEAVDMVLGAIEEAEGGEIFIPKIASMKIVDLVKALDDEAKIKIIGIRPGEKLHETLVSEDEGRNTVEYIMNGKEYYVVLPEFVYTHKRDKYENCKKVESGFMYRSDLNEEWLNKNQILEMINSLDI